MAPINRFVFFGGILKSLLSQETPDEAPSPAPDGNGVSEAKTSAPVTPGPSIKKKLKAGSFFAGQDTSALSAAASPRHKKKETPSEPATLGKKKIPKVEWSSSRDGGGV